MTDKERLILLEAFAGGVVDALNGQDYGGNFETEGEQQLYEDGRHLALGAPKSYTDGIKVRLDELVPI